MTREELTTLEAAELVSAVKDSKKIDNSAEGLNQYDPKKHRVKSTTHRPDKPTFMPVAGQFEDDGRTPKVETKYVPVAKIALPLQKFIIKQRASFAVGNRVTFKPSIPDSEVFAAAWDTWNSSKMQYLLKEIAVKMMAETEVALIWYSVKDERAANGIKLRNRVISPSTGDQLYPVFDRYNDMIAFGRGYLVDEVEYFDLYTAENLRRFRTGKEGFEEYFKDVDAEGQGILENLPYGKIPVIYWSQERPECDDVVDLINAREFNQSDFFDNNQYYGDPLLFLKGTAVNMPAKGAAGKVLEGSDDADAKFLTPGDYTAARKLEFDMLDAAIFTLTRSARLDAESMKGLGDLSAAAMDRMLISPHMAARDMQDGEFGRGVQRCMNFLLAVYSELLTADGVEAEPQFSLFRIDDAAERVELAMKANGNKPVVDQGRSMVMAGTADDEEAAEEMLQAIKAETPAPAAPPANEPGTRTLPIQNAV